MAEICQKDAQVFGRVMFCVTLLLTEGERERRRAASSETEKKKREVRARTTYFGELCVGKVNVTS